MTALKFGERPRHLEDLDDARVVTIPVGEDPSWSNRPRKTRPGPLACACGREHLYVDNNGRPARCGFCCRVHWSPAK